MKYQGSVLGVIWVLIKPLAQFLILYVVFSNVRGNDNDSFMIYLIIGIVVFTFYSESLLQGATSLIEKAHIILKLNFDRTLVVYSSIFLALVNLLVNSIIIVIFSFFNPVAPNIGSILYVIFIIFALTIFQIGVSFFTSVLTVQFRDIDHIIQIFLQLLFYASPVFFNIDELLPESIASILRLNPLYSILGAIRAAYIDGEIIYETRIIFFLSVSVIIFIAGYFYFNTRVKKIAEYF